MLRCRVHCISSNFAGCHSSHRSFVCCLLFERKDFCSKLKNILVLSHDCVAQRLTQKMMNRKFLFCEHSLQFAPINRLRLQINNFVCSTIRSSLLSLFTRTNLFSSRFFSDAFRFYVISSYLRTFIVICGIKIHKNFCFFLCRRWGRRRKTMGNK